MTHRLTRDCPATSIPSGTPITLESGSEVDVVQTLGGSVTVRHPAGLARIASEDASAIEGLELEAAASGSVGAFSEQAVWEALKGCFDPEIPVNIVDLGLIYDLSIEQTATGGHLVEVKMTLTAPGCGMGPVIAEDARRRIAALSTVETAKVHIVWDPIWNPRMISEAGRKTLGLE